jgi:hypothetical protein
MTQGTSVTPRRPGATLFATLAVALVLAGCSGDPKAEGVDGESDSEGRGAGSLVARSPLTGLEIGTTPRSTRSWS